MPSLLISAPHASPKTVPLEGDSLPLGRSVAGPLSFPEDPGLSRQHLVFEREVADADARLDPRGTRTGGWPPAGGVEAAEKRLASELAQAAEIQRQCLPALTEMEDVRHARA